MPHDPEPTGPYLPPPPGERFAPGTVLAGRYRVVAVLGRGGMGEVYRADDLSLGQPVALKFLPEHLAADPDRLARFRKEVAAARKVSHPHVCRVYDLTEWRAGGVNPLIFLTMEYVDGEDLASLLKRVGRVPEEKGVEVARQLCGALAAVHDQGLLHRDLKPANVMLDGRGRVRLTDFGLAAAADDLSATEVRSGTPLYQAPEQAAGREVTVRSDVYALGLVLYELFTGRRAFADARRDAPPSRPSSHVAGLSPAVERVVLRCLEPDPANRPRSAAEVLAGLPGGDPLAAAVAAGETPSPKLVADAGEVGLIRPWVGLALLAALVLELVALAWLNDRTVFRRVPLPKSPEVLADVARRTLADLGADPNPADTASGFRPDTLADLYANREDPAFIGGEPARVGGPAPTYFFYRQGPAPLTPLSDGGADSLVVSDTNPPPTTTGMAGVVLDPAGNLLGFTIARPPPRPQDKPAAVDWGPWFRRAGLDLGGQFEPDPDGPRAVPPVPATEAFAWKMIAGLGDCRVEAGSYGGRPTYLRVTGPWQPSAGRDGSSESGSGHGTYFSLVEWLNTAVFVVMVLVATRNLIRGRADLRTAGRMVLVIFALSLTGRALAGWHASDLYTFAGSTLGFGAVISVLAGGLYLAVEPYLRRRWPWRLTGWVRVFRGRLGDPLVGRDVLIGLVAGMLIRLLVVGGIAILGSLQSPAYAAQGPYGVTWGLTAPLSVKLLFGSCLCVYWPLNDLSLVFVLYLLVRREWTAWAIAVAIWSTVSVVPFWTATLAADTVGVTVSFAVVGVQLAVITRFGPLAAAGCNIAWYISWWSPLTLQTSAWYFGGGLATMAVLVALGAYGCYTATGGREWVRELVRGDD